MRKMYLSAPLPFVGQKRMFARKFIKVLEQFKDKTVFVDLFGGSGLLSHITKNECPHVPKLAKFKPPRCPIGVYWNTLCLMRDVWTIKTYMI